MWLGVKHRRQSERIAQQATMIVVLEHGDHAVWNVPQLVTLDRSDVKILSEDCSQYCSQIRLEQDARWAQSASSLN